MESIIKEFFTTFLNKAICSIYDAKRLSTQNAVTNMLSTK